ncbi:hypothetical protein [Shewanella sp. Isolate11]|uniref:hypothetical protein n=1 Tax=Shewanella sp. Isolate11 TaxID=2908530 RepID=UPI001EFE962B|nr:hypothetical protein [Shewanella sp. Isolate11]MCG9697779.1 hypothetical protein [Shewanella sp. Isolate11]
MISLDSLYAMLARPVTKVEKRKRIVEQTTEIDPLAADNHDTVQSQLPPHLERRRRPDRRAQPRNEQEGDRRGKAQREQAKLEQQSTSEHPHIDIEI